MSWACLYFVGVLRSFSCVICLLILLIVRSRELLSISSIVLMCCISFLCCNFISCSVACSLRIWQSFSSSILSISVLSVLSSFSSSPAPPSVVFFGSSWTMIVCVEASQVLLEATCVPSSHLTVMSVDETWIANSEVAISISVEMSRVLAATLRLLQQQRFFQNPILIEYFPFLSRSFPQRAKPYFNARPTAIYSFFYSSWSKTIGFKKTFSLSLLSSSNVLGFQKNLLYVSIIHLETYWFLTKPSLEWDCGKMQHIYGSPLIRELDPSEQSPRSAAARDEKDGRREGSKPISKWTSIVHRPRGVFSFSGESEILWASEAWHRGHQYSVDRSMFVNSTLWRYGSWPARLSSWTGWLDRTAGPKSLSSPAGLAWKAGPAGRVARTAGWPSSCLARLDVLSSSASCTGRLACLAGTVGWAV